MEDILDKERELQALHKRVAQDAEKLALVQNENKQLLRQIEIMKRMQFTTEQEKEAQREKTISSSSLDRRLGQSVRPEFKVKKSQTVESISLVKSLELLNGNKTETGQEMGEISWSRNKQDGDPAHEDEMQVARELVKKNKRIFELEQVGGNKNTGLTGFHGLTLHLHLLLKLKISCTLHQLQTSH